MAAFYGWKIITLSHLHGATSTATIKRKEPQKKDQDAFPDYDIDCYTLVVMGVGL